MELNKEKRELIHDMSMSIIKTTNIKLKQISEVIKNGIGTVGKKRSRKEGQAFNEKDLLNLLIFTDKHTAEIMQKRLEIKEILDSFKINTK